jgi:hypothetical protein
LYQLETAWADGKILAFSGATLMTFFEVVYHHRKFGRGPKLGSSVSLMLFVMGPQISLCAATPVSQEEGR